MPMETTCPERAVWSVVAFVLSCVMLGTGGLYSDVTRPRLFEPTSVSRARVPITQPEPASRGEVSRRVTDHVATRINTQIPVFTSTFRSTRVSPGVGMRPYDLFSAPGLAFDDDEAVLQDPARLSRSSQVRAERRVSLLNLRVARDAPTRGDSQQAVLRKRQTSWRPRTSPR